MDQGYQPVNGAQPGGGAGQTRRRWSVSEKARIVAEGLEPRAKISRVARRYGISVGFYRIGGAKPLPLLNSKRDPASAFVPVVLKDDSVGRTSARWSMVIEIAVGDAVIRLKGAVDPAALRSTPECVLQNIFEYPRAQD